jgi:diacylglycerol kinase (ATP)
MEPDSAFSLARLFRAAGYSRDGLAAAWRSEASFRLEAVAALVLVPFGLWLGATGVERALLAGSVLLVLLVELINSSIEATVDCASPGPHPLAKQAKDIGSAAVLLALGLAGLVWMALLF